METTCAICSHAIGENDACIQDMRTKQAFCSDRCSKAYLLVKCPWCFASEKKECHGQGTHPTRIAAAAAYVKKLLATPIEELIERSSLGTPEAKRLRSQACPDVVRRILRRTDR